MDGEEALVARARGGDGAAFTQLMQHYQSACYGLAWRLLVTLNGVSLATWHRYWALPKSGPTRTSSR